MTIIKNGIGLENYPFRRIEHSLVSVIKKEWVSSPNNYTTSSVSEIALTCLDCFCDLHDINLYQSTFPNEAFGRIA